MSEPIDLRERGCAVVADDIVTATPSAFWRSADCTVSKGAGDASWTLHAGDLVGVARIETSAGRVTLRIRPKLDTANVFFLADYAYEQRHDPLRLLQHDKISLESLLQDPSACLLTWHAREIHRFATRWLRRNYRTADRALNAKIKGRPLLGTYVSRHLATGDAAHIPCRVQERTHDTPNNRLLKAGLRYIIASSHVLPVAAAQRAVRREASAALPLFAEVSDITVSTRDLRAISVRGPQRHYKTVLEATVSLLEGRLFTDELASLPNANSFMWDMPTLFQEALRGVIDSALGIALEGSSVDRAQIVDSSGRQILSSKIDPDLVLKLDEYSTLVLDTKYKDAWPSSHGAGDEVTLVADRHRIKVSRADIYQIVAYTRHQRWLNATGGLLYPIVLADGDQLPSPLRVSGFEADVWMLFVDIGPFAARNLPSFLAKVRGLQRLAHQPASARDDR